ncbi:transcriptional regulator [Streptococcus parauberis]|uniref:ArpU family phage packaging/lysis transcriptional regulator n=1 Tax=Streptococcus TaxID=1301 RepID=UPI0008FA6B69|nr:ArpU family phage packaging/lysis transcriptional regulator [Streptococcus parauberis]MDT2749122.1 ArpU family phage packaging/lysis transcriptional regulator [Streptococcus parauberis]OHY30856.1 transcriptional regulator [Streptococcus parauberis]PIO79492.1 hypothetical protein ADO05_00512 [Streptococcus parauberis]POS67454.1 hypothetical protein AOS90_00900 [Streptococcus parauberis]
MNSVNAVRKLNEFRKWQNISGRFEIKYDSNFILELNCNSNPPYKRRNKLSINRECALEELNAIMHAINCISVRALRQILILNYLISDKLKNYDIYSMMKKSESWYYPKKKQALEEFSKHYRESCLMDN